MKPLQISKAELNQMKRMFKKLNRENTKLQKAQADMFLKVKEELKDVKYDCKQYIEDIERFNEAIQDVTHFIGAIYIGLVYNTIKDKPLTITNMAKLIMTKSKELNTSQTLYFFKRTYLTNNNNIQCLLRYLRDKKCFEDGMGGYYQQGLVLNEQGIRDLFGFPASIISCYIIQFFCDSELDFIELANETDKRIILAKKKKIESFNKKVTPLVEKNYRR